MDEFETVHPVGPITWQIVGAITCGAIEGIMEEASGFFGGLAMAFAGAHNHEVERREFHEQAALEIERITSTPMALPQDFWDET